MRCLNTLMREFREDEIRSSCGYICAECNKSAYYFKTKNNELNSEKPCLICSICRPYGILVEDFLGTLKRHLPEHYKLVNYISKDSISLKDILK